MTQAPIDEKQEIKRPILTFGIFVPQVSCHISYFRISSSWSQCKHHSFDGYATSLVALPFQSNATNIAAVAVGKVKCRSLRVHSATLKPYFAFNIDAIQKKCVISI